MVELEKKVIEFDTNPGMVEGSAPRKTLVNFYKAVARKMGCVLEGNYQFDCREICISEAIQDGWFDDWCKQGIDKASLCMFLALSGPKVDSTLSGFDVNVTDKFFVPEAKVGDYNA